jgi:hypothetical protein
VQRERALRDSVIVRWCSAERAVTVSFLVYSDRV